MRFAIRSAVRSAVRSAARFASPGTPAAARAAVCAAVLASVLVVLPGTAPAQEAATSPATPSRSLPFDDDTDRASLLAALDRQAAYLAKLKKAEVPFGTGKVAVERLRRTHEAFSRLVRDAWGTPEFARRLEEQFELVSAGTSHFTGYYLPGLEARRSPDERFRFPLYQRPPVAAGSPWPTHAEIEDGRILAGKGLEIAWVADEFDRYILMVQGSGMLRFEDGSETFVNYGGKNGHPYASLGKMLIADGKLSTASVSIPTIRKYFQEHPEEQHGYLVRNASYVFFRLQAEGPFGVDGIQLTPGRSIATDKKFWPSGGIAYVRYPKVAAWRGKQPAAWTESGRFVCDQDTGGAIRGMGRLDFYWGAGEEAAAIAGTLNASGSLAYLLIRQSPGEPSLGGIDHANHRSAHWGARRPWGDAGPPRAERAHCGRNVGAKGAGIAPAVRAGVPDDHRGRAPVLQP